MFEEEIDLPPEIPGSKLKPNAGRTLSENMADVEGVRQSFVAFKNYQKEEGYREEGRIWTTEDITADQLFFLGWGIILCGKFSEEELKAIILWDTHSPPVLRVNNVVANVEGFANAFRCSPGSPMNPKNRCSIF
ncbi:peptidase family M13 [Necator americanus]|uniref:Peptidase family M13 n=1 Tax=Necator americanus TaxID=51031 RepID=W2TJT2_NECAM|nr:peptidase family M13 [Necator americanus]ETN82058.1 peptidase family M13 [Necator americanus]